MELETQTTRENSPKQRKAAGDEQLSFWEAAAPATPAPKKLTKAAVTKLVNKVSPEVSSTVGSEIMNGNLRPATWALALAYSNGSHDQAITHYARLRLEELAGANENFRKKEQALEARRRAGFKKMRTPLPRLYLGNLTPAGFRNRRRISLSPLWLAGLWLSVTAACAAITRFFSEKFDDPTTRIPVSGSIGIAALAICAVVMLHLLIPKTRLLLRYAIPFGAWTAACSSCYFGLMILKESNGQGTSPTNVNFNSNTERKIIISDETSHIMEKTAAIPSKALAQSK